MSHHTHPAFPSIKQIVLRKETLTMKHFTLHPYEGKRLLFDIMGKCDAFPIPVVVDRHNLDGSIDCTLNNPSIASIHYVYLPEYRSIYHPYSNLYLNVRVIIKYYRPLFFIKIPGTR